MELNGIALGSWYPGYPESPAYAVHEFDTDDMGRRLEQRVRDAASQVLLARMAFGYDDLGRPTETRVYEPASASTAALVYSTEWEGLSKRKVDIGPAGRSVTRLFDSLARVKEEIDSATPNPNSTTYAYADKTHFLRKVTRKNRDEAVSGNPVVEYQTEYVRDAIGRVLQILDGPTGSALTHAFAYYATGETESYTDPAGKVQRYLPDALGRLSEHYLPGAQPIWNGRYYLDWTGSTGRTELQQVDGRGLTTRTVFDFVGRTQFIKEPGAPTSDPTSGSPHQPFTKFMEYDAASRLSTMYAGDGIQVNYSLDGMGRLIARSSPTPALSSMVSWLHGRDIVQRDALGRVTWSASLSGPNGTGGAYVQETHEYDALNRKLAESFNFLLTSNWIRVGSTYPTGDPFRTGTTYENGLSGNLDNIAAAFTPDSIGRFQSVSWQTSGAMRQVASYLHEGGLIRRRTTNWGSQTGQSFDTDYVYDDYGRMSQIDQSFSQDARVEFEYDLASNLVKETYKKHVTATTYNTRVGDRFAYDTHHRLWKAWLGSDQDHMNQANPEAPGQNEPVGTFVKKLTYELDAANNREAVAVQNGSGGSTEVTDYSAGAADNRYADVADLAMQYDERGNTTFDGNFYYVYDEQNRLSEVYIVASVDMAQAGAQTSLATDPATGSTREVVRRGRYVVNNPGALRAARASILSRATVNLAEFIQRHEERAYAAQFKETLSPLAVQPEPGSEAAASAAEPGTLDFTQLQMLALYMYDVHDRRVVRMVLGVADTRVAWDGWQEAQELVPVSGQAVPKKQFLWGEQLDELVAFRVKQPSGSLWDEYYVAEGGAHCPQRVLNSAGAVVEAQEYDPYGQTSFFGASGSSGVSQVGNPFGWKAVRIDPETGLLYMRHRYYTPRWGRFLTQDPLGVWGDHTCRGQGYCYGADSPSSCHDPMGLQVSVKVGGKEMSWAQLLEKGQGGGGGQYKGPMDVVPPWVFVGRVDPAELPEDRTKLEDVIRSMRPFFVRFYRDRGACRDLWRENGGVLAVNYRTGDLLLFPVPDRDRETNRVNFDSAIRRFQDARMSGGKLYGLALVHSHPAGGESTHTVRLEGTSNRDDYDLLEIDLNNDGKGARSVVIQIDTFGYFNIDVRVPGDVRPKVKYIR